MAVIRPGRNVLTLLYVPRSSDTPASPRDPAARAAFGMKKKFIQSNMYVLAIMLL